MSLHGLDGHQMQQGLAGQMDASLISWGDGDDEDGEGEFDSFTLPDGVSLLHPASHVNELLII